MLNVGSPSPNQSYHSTPQISNSKTTSNPQNVKLDFNEWVVNLMEVMENAKKLCEGDKLWKFNDCASILHEMHDVGEITHNMMVDALDFLIEKWPQFFLNLEPKSGVSWLIRKLGRVRIF